MPTPVEWLNEFQVNTGTAATGFQSDPKIVGLANGDFVVVYEESASGAIGTDPGTDLVAKIYSPTGGVRAPGAFQLNTSFFSDDERDFDLTATHDGFAIAYVDDSISQANATAIRYQRFDFSGDSLSSVTIASENVAADFLANPQLAANLIPTNDDVFIAFNDDVGADTDINARVIDQAGTLGAEFAAAQNSADFDRLGDVAVLDTGNFVTVYEENDPPTGTSLEFTIRTPAGGVVGSSSFAIENAPAFDPAVTSLADGAGFVVTYVDGSNIIMRGFTNTGAPDFGPITVAGGVSNQNEPSIVAMPQGGFFVAWDDDTSGDLFGRLYNSNGTPDGAIVTIEDVPTTNIDLGVTGDGRILVTWQAEFGEIFASVWDPRPTLIDPDDFDTVTENFVDSNIITTARNTGSNVVAGAGNKTVFGQFGNDTITSSGSGEYFGGFGNDLMFAGLGAFETLNGGFGNDTLNTTLFNGSYDVDLVTGDTNFNPESFVQFENVITGNGSDTITGTSGNNLINTGLGNDSIDAGGGNDTVVAGLGNDIVSASTGNDLIFGDGGNDTLRSSGTDTIFGGAGNDLIFSGIGLPEELDGGSGVDTLNTTSFNSAYRVSLLTGNTNFAGEVFTNFENLISGSGNDTLTGTNAANSIVGNDGNDLIVTFDSNDTLVGGNGNDTMRGGDGTDRFFGGNGDDTVFGQLGNDVIFGQSNNDLLDGGAGNDQLFGDIGNDILRGAEGNDLLDGGSGNDTLASGNGNDTLRGQSGNDLLLGSGDSDSMEGGSGNDELDGENGNDTMDGGDGADTLRGGNGNDDMEGGIGDDRLFGNASNDIMRGGSGNDRLDGGSQNDTLNGDAGNDELLGADGFDFLRGGSGNDTLAGGNGNDTLDGGSGRDVLRGQGGNDVFDFNSTSESIFGVEDLIDGFNGAGPGGGDRIDLSTIDANTVFFGNQAFNFVGVQTIPGGLAFGAGTLWVQNSGSQTLVYGNVDNDAVIEIAIRINDGGTTASDYVSGDFFL